jgi:FixJ family two-component response regulator
MTIDNNVVYIVDDDAAVRDAVGLLLSLHGYKTAFFADGAAFLQAWSKQMQGCLLLDIRMPGTDGLTLQKQLLEKGSALPVIIITGHGDVDASREAFKAYAIDFLEKPLQKDQLIQAIEVAFVRNLESEEQRLAVAAYNDGYATLTAREREVLEHVSAGRHNREIADLLQISVRTVEVHKARIMDKLGTRNSVDLVRRYLQNEHAMQRGTSSRGSS